MVFVTRVFDFKCVCAPGVSLARGTVAALLERPKVLSELLLCQRDLAGMLGDEGAAEARRPRGVDAVVHVDAQGGAHHQVHRETNAHQVTGLVPWSCVDSSNW